MLGIVHDDCPSLQRRTGQGSIPQVDANRFRLGHVLARRNSCWCSQCPLPGRPFLRRGREQKVCRASECYFSFALGPVLGCPLQGKVVTAATCCSGDASGGLGRLHCHTPEPLLCPICSTHCGPSIGCSCELAFASLPFSLDVVTYIHTTCSSRGWCRRRERATCELSPKSPLGF